jgi:hypothetical protein
MSHAILSPSAASRWINCPPSARLELTFPQGTTSEHAEEGTVAHSLSEALIANRLELWPKARYHKQFANCVGSKYYTEAMLNYCDDYATYVIEKFNEARVKTPDAKIFLEEKIDLTEFIQEGFGTGDVIIIADGILDIIDLKYGKGVAVSAVDNAQLKVYGLGAFIAHSLFYDIDMVRMTIYQPRLDSITTDEIAVPSLLIWAEDVLRPKAKLAWEGKGEFKPGKWCGFCKAKAQCRAYATMNLQIAAHNFMDPELLSDDEIVDVMQRLPELTRWAEAIKAYAYSKALEGKKWPGMKLVAGRSNRQYTDEIKIGQTLESAGYTKDQIYQMSVKGITSLEKELGKKVFNNLVGDYIIKPIGSPVLVSENDKREEYSLNLAENDFA